MKFAFPVVVVAVAVFAAAAAAQTAPDEATVTGRGPKRACAPVRAKLLEPFFPFGEAIPAGTIVLGTVKDADSAGAKMAAGDRDPQWRFHALCGGPEVEFARLQLPDGRELPAHTVAAAGLNSIYIEPPAKTEQNKARQR